jgi:hypothetical protein
VTVLANDRKSEGYVQKDDSKSAASSAIKLGLVSVASALAGGLAAAWWYRKTLTKLQNPIANEDQYRAGSRERDGEAAESGENDDLPHLIND